MWTTRCGPEHLGPWRIRHYWRVARDVAERREDVKPDVARVHRRVASEQALLAAPTGFEPVPPP